jgi:serine/threonine protein kinase
MRLTDHEPPSVVPEGYNEKKLQSVAMRAPEVWAGHPCTHVVDVWSIGATLLVWIDKQLLGNKDWKQGTLSSDAWCIAKMIGGFETDDDKMPELSEKARGATTANYEFGRALLQQPDDGTPESMHVPVRPILTKVVQELGLPPEVVAVLRIMTVLDHTKRPTAKEVLESMEFEELLAAADAAAASRATRASGDDDAQYGFAGPFGRLGLA